MNIGHLAMLWGRYPQARRLLARGLELARAGGYQKYRDMIVVSEAHLDFYEGNWDGLADRVGAFVAGADLHLITRFEALLVTGLLQAATGVREPAARSLDRALAAAGQTGMADAVMEPAAALSRIALAEGRVEDALRMTEEPFAIMVLKDIWAWAACVGPVRAAALVRAGRLDEAAELEAAFGRGLSGKTMPPARAALTECGAIVAEGRGDLAAAAALFGQAAADWHALPRPYDALLASEGQGRCLLAAGQQAAAVPVLTEAMSGLSALGARGDAVRLIGLLNQAGVPARRPWLGGRRGYGGQLSPRELDVVRLVVRGQTNRQIAQALVLSPKTVANHVDSAMRKVAVSSRAALAARAVEDGLLRGEEPGAASAAALPAGKQ
jgi:DNA-binding CsgD family transcriptional regulator/tetratricopeptide (TPR) repeat protein